MVIIGSGEKKSLYLNMIIGTIDITLIYFGLIFFIADGQDSYGSTLTILGIILTIQYMYHLEGKAGISKKFIWIRGIIFALILVGSVNVILN
ncbi:hypothetical protein [Sutcliffiella rhizosphaerae]|uniref:Uncharacterized protein n=1 Tax=Sutcliffiella rhizosphaerae TaxID=2880967 RepID=A0ABM8YKG8_9BACI|nr:hypothetical protein [Sutcliffiella rhizosphaerae]CAG9620438.1 hypothetical protein BACCIP111883_01206 [Sutcliffiella rhizosphaerae]